MNKYRKKLDDSAVVPPDKKVKVMEEAGVARILLLIYTVSARSSKWYDAKTGFKPLLWI